MPENLNQCSEGAQLAYLRRAHCAWQTPTEFLDVRWRSPSGPMRTALPSGRARAGCAVTLVRPPRSAATTCMSASRCATATATAAAGRSPRSRLPTSSPTAPVPPSACLPSRIRRRWSSRRGARVIIRSTGCLTAATRRARSRRQPPARARAGRRSRVLRRRPDPATSRDAQPQARPARQPVTLLVLRRGRPRRARRADRRAARGPRPAVPCVRSGTADRAHAPRPVTCSRSQPPSTCGCSPSRAPNREGKIRLPVSQDSNPSLQLYPDGSFYCFGSGCRAGGSIFDFAARLWGIVPRGRWVSRAA